MLLLLFWDLIILYKYFSVINGSVYYTKKVAVFNHIIEKLLKICTTYDIKF